ncbi:MAG: hypothetical protein LR015_09585 [Verrucomicrobia bacterium]|nr:hypothetical protein [Verrucomicrobiota bacterium]
MLVLFLPKAMALASWDDVILGKTEEGWEILNLNFAFAPDIQSNPSSDQGIWRFLPEANVWIYIIAAPEPIEAPSGFAFVEGGATRPQFRPNRSARLFHGFH